MQKTELNKTISLKFKSVKEKLIEKISIFDDENKGYISFDPIKKRSSRIYNICNENKFRKLKRGITRNETKIIENSLVAKFHETLNSILDLDQQKMIDKFKRLASSKRTSYPAYYKKYVVAVKTYLDFKTVSLYSTNAIQNLKNSGFDGKTINMIKNIFGKQNYLVDIYQITKHEIDELKLKMGVAYSIGGRVIFSYVDATSQSKRYEHYCNMERNTSEETCVDDSVCVEECNAYKRLVRDPRHADRDIPGFNKKQYKNNLKQILLADVTNEVYNILNEIKFYKSLISFFSFFSIC